MIVRRYKHYFNFFKYGIILSYFLSLCFPAITIALETGLKTIPTAKNGILDLRDWNFNRNGAIKLDGEWEFYWKKLLYPHDFSSSNPQKKSGLIKVPSIWNNYKTDEGLISGDGYATYRIVILMSTKEEQIYAISLSDIATACNIYINGKNVSSIGTVGKSKELMSPEYRTELIDFVSKESSVEIIFQISNYYHWKGGLWSNIFLGKAKDIRDSKNSDLRLEVFLLGSILIMGIYHLCLYMLRKTDKSSINFSIFCFFIVLRLLSTGEYLLTNLFPMVSWDILVKFQYISYYLSVTFGVMFIYS